MTSSWQQTRNGESGENGKPLANESGSRRQSRANHRSQRQPRGEKPQCHYRESTFFFLGRKLCLFSLVSFSFVLFDCQYICLRLYVGSDEYVTSPHLTSPHRNPPTLNSSFYRSSYSRDIFVLRFLHAPYPFPPLKIHFHMTSWRQILYSVS